MVNGDAVTYDNEAHVARAVEICRRPGPIVVLVQDNPDPDALASAAALRHLIFTRLRKRAVIAYGGTCGRAENRAMMRVLRIDARQVSAEDLIAFSTVCLVDTQPQTGNNILLSSHKPEIVIDHHPLPKRCRWSADFADVRPHYGACSTILYEYLQAAQAPIGSELATALFYGIQSDTQDLGRETSPAGTRAYQELFLQADKKKLAAIRRAPVPAAYFRALLESLEFCVVAGKTVISCIPESNSPEMMAEVADMLMRLEGTRSVVCYGVFDDMILVSARAADARSNMARKMKQVAARLGNGGGHRVMAGAQIPIDGDTEQRLRLVYGRILKAFAPNADPQPLIGQEE